MIVVLRVAALAAILGATSVRGRAAAQDPDAVAEPPPATVAVDDEVVVRGQRPAELRADIELAENAFYERFNAINSDDELDIVCRQEVLIGSKIPRRICRPKFTRAADAAYSEGTVRGLQGSGFAGIPQQFIGLSHVKHGQLQKEMRELAAQDPELLEALTRLVTLQQEYESSGKE